MSDRAGDLPEFIVHLKMTDEQLQELPERGYDIGTDFPCITGKLGYINFVKACRKEIEEQRFGTDEFTIGTL